jgi:hypothetical protein
MDRREAIKQAALISGFAMSGSMMTVLLQSCQSDATPVTEPWTPAFFTEEEGLALAEIGETILPKTDTPGARDALVHEYIDQAVAACMDEEDQEKFKTGFTALLADCQQEHQKSFVECDAPTRLAFLNKQDKASREFMDANPDLENEDIPFFINLKQMILFGYFTAEKVGTEVTAYLPIPGGYEPCMPYEEGTPMWTF